MPREASRRARLGPSSAWHGRKEVCPGWGAGEMLAHVPAQPLGGVLGHRETLSETLRFTNVYHRMVNGLLTGKALRFRPQLSLAPNLHSFSLVFARACHPSGELAA
jgi:hypothetical protein